MVDQPAVVVEILASSTKSCPELCLVPCKCMPVILNITDTVCMYHAITYCTLNYLQLNF